MFHLAMLCSIKAAAALTNRSRKEEITTRVMKFATIGLIHYRSAAEIGNNASVCV